MGLHPMDGYAAKTNGQTPCLGVISDASCILCNRGVSESHNHLFFDCPYSGEVWHEVLRKKVNRGPKAWEDEKTWFILHAKGKGLRISILKISLAAALYHVWGERNRS